MIDAVTSLAFSVQSSKGVYALLLGSGLSTAAGIPTGWDITLDLIRRSAAAAGEECGTDAATWYRTKYARDPDYSDLLDALARTPADRANLLSGYFEPSADDLTNGLKAPTLAHKSIARMVAKDYVRVIVTTNFDRLLERALESEGISPTVISTADAALGALPLAHARCTLVKINGDYRDTRIRNTILELESYDAEMDRLLDRIFDEYGLIVCGWSATWDRALCRAILRCPSRRFTTYWARRTRLDGDARALVVQRRAVELEIDSADAFFATIEAKLDALERYAEPHPISVKLAVVSLKKFIAEDRYRIELRDLVTSETEKVFKSLSPLAIPRGDATFDQLFERMRLYESTSQILMHLVANGAFWGGVTAQALWCTAIARIAGLKKMVSGMSDFLLLQIYPACLLFYSAGLGAIAGNHYETLKGICRDVLIVDNGVEKPVIRVALPWMVLTHSTARGLPGYENHQTPVNDLVFDVLREPLREYLPADSDYADAFDRFEYLTALVHLDLRLSSPSENFADAPLGSFSWRSELQNKPAIDRLSEEADRGGDDWAPVRSGLFQSLSRFRELDAHYRKEILPRRWR